jgi:uncharacterized protein with HEPN domain
MNEADVIRLKHMLDAAREALSFATGRKREDLDTDRGLSLILVREVEVIGEAASRVSQETREQLAQIPWRAIIGMRNRLIHRYNDINLSILWYTVQTSIPELIGELEKLSELQ